MKRINLKDTIQTEQLDDNLYLRQDFKKEKADDIMIDIDSRRRIEHKELNLGLLKEIL